MTSRKRAPSRAAKDAASEAAVKVIARARLFRVLVVEDSPAVAAAIVNTLGNRLGRDAVFASAATEDDALALVRESPFSLAIVDLQLAQGTGFGVIRAAHSLARPPIIVVFTNHAVPALQVAAREAGADHFLDKAKGMPQLVDIALRVAGVTPAGPINEDR